MRTLCLFLFGLFVLTACHKFYSYEGGVIPVITDSIAYTCTGARINESYVAGKPLTNADTVLQNLNVTKLGNYNFKTDTVNGIYFYASGSFAKTGDQTITFKASGTPIASGNFTYHFSNINSCLFSVSFAPAVINAVYTLVGAPNTCSGFTVSGFYATTFTLGNLDTVSVSVNVTTAGVFHITTDTVNGMVFSRSGTFATTGLQNVGLIGSGTPMIADTSTFTPKTGTSKCTFNVVVQPAILTAKINGVFNTFNYAAYAKEAFDFNNNQWQIELTGSSTMVVNGSNLMQLFFWKTNSKPVTGAYINTVAATQAGGYSLTASYFDITGKQTTSLSPPSDTINPFTITITKITTTNMEGSFSGQLYQFLSTTPAKTITEGYFNLPIKQ